MKQIDKLRKQLAAVKRLQELVGKHGAVVCSNRLGTSRQNIHNWLTGAHLPSERFCDKILSTVAPCLPTRRAYDQLI